MQGACWHIGADTPADTLSFTRRNFHDTNIGMLMCRPYMFESM